MAPDPDDERGHSGDGDAEELQRLREEVARLRAESAKGAGVDAAAAGGAARPSRVGRSARWAVSIALVVLASLLVVVSVVARDVRSELLDTDRYVETVSPLAGEPAVQDAVATQVTREIVTRLDVEAVAEDALSRLTELGAPQVITGLAAVAILVAPNWRRALVAVALGLALSMVLLAAAMGLVRAWYLSNATGEVLPTDAALDIARTLLAPLRLAMRAVLVLGLVVALAAFLVGPSGPARWLRALGGRARAATRARLEGDREPSPVEAWIGGHKGALHVGIVAVGVLVLAFWTYPSGATVLSIVLAVVAAMAVIELVGWTRPAEAPPSSPAAG